MSTQYLFVAAIKAALKELFKKLQSTNSNHGSKYSQNVTAVVLCQNQFYSMCHRYLLYICSTIY